MTKNTSQENSVTNESIVAEFVSKYDSATGGEKTRIRNSVTEAAMVAMKDGNADLALLLIAARDDMKSVTKSTPTRTPGMNLADRHATLMVALNKVQGQIDALTGDDVASSDYVPTVDDKQVTRFSTVAATTKSATFRGAVAQYVADVANHLGAGEYTVADIASAPVQYPTDNAKPGGAIGAYLDRNSDATIDTEEGASYEVTTNQAGHRVIVVTV